MDNIGFRRNNTTPKKTKLNRIPGRNAIAIRGNYIPVDAVTTTSTSMSLSLLLVVFSRFSLLISAPVSLSSVSATASDKRQKRRVLKE